MSNAFERGVVLMGLGKNQEALEQFGMALKDLPNNSTILLNIAQCEFRLGRMDEAEATVKRTLEADPNEAHAHYVWSCIHTHRGYGDDEKCIQEALRLKPDNTAYIAKLARIQLSEDQNDKAKETLKRGLALDPNHVDLLTLNAELIGRTPFSAQAAHQEISKALRVEPESSTAHLTRGWIAYDSHDLDTARAGFLEALRIEPDSSEAEKGLWSTQLARNALMQPMLAVTHFAWPPRKKVPSDFMTSHIACVFILVFVTVVNGISWWWWGLLALSALKLPYRWFVAAHTPIINYLLSRDLHFHRTMEPENLRASKVIIAVHAFALALAAASYFVQQPALLCAAIFSEWTLVLRTPYSSCDSEYFGGWMHWAALFIELPILVGGIYWIYRNPAQPPGMSEFMLLACVLFSAPFIIVFSAIFLLYSIDKLRGMKSRR